MILKDIPSKRQLFAKCVYYTFKLFGVATINVHVKPANSRVAQLTSFASSKFGIAYNLFLIAFILVLYYFALEVSLSKFYLVQEIRLDNIIFDVHNLSAGLTSIFILLYFCGRQGKTASIANDIKSINDLVVKIDGESHYQKILSSLKTIFLIKSIIWIPIIATIDITQLFITLSYVYIQACNLTILTCILQYSVILNVLQHILGVVNANFRSVTQPPKSHRSNNCINVDGRTVVRFESVWRTRELYLSVCKVSDDLSQFYSPPMLLSLCHIFITLLFLSHCIIKPIILHGVSTLPTKLSLYCLFRMSQYIISLIILTKMTTAAMAESRNSGKILNEALGDTRNLCVDPKVYHFSNYLLHRTLNFSVFGLFSLDESLIMSIIGSITTYLVICLQFQKSDSDSD